MLGSLLDRTLDLAVVPGYTSIGYRLRSPGWEQPDPGAMDGKVALVTGASSGLGLATAEGLARLGAGVRLLVRDEERGQRASQRITARTGNHDISVSLCDISDLESVRDFVAGFEVEEQSLDVLVNNAGAMVDDRTLTAEGVELTFATNVLGPFLLTNLLTPLLVRSAPSRVINVSSGGMYTQRLDVEDLQTEHRGYDGPSAYARSKRAEVILTEMWAERLAPFGVVVHAMHPGWADTPGVRNSLPRFHRLTAPLLRSPEEGADTIVWLASASEPAHSSGDFWQDRSRRPTHRVPWTKESAQDRRRLWAECERLSGWHEVASATSKTNR